MKILFSIILAASFVVAEISAQEFVLDQIIASVNGKAITLSDLRSRLNSANIQPKEIATDPALSSALDTLILEQLIEADAKAKHVNVSDGEIASYIHEVAKRNNLTEEQLKVELTKQGRSLEQYSQQVRIDILRGKLTNQLMRGGVAISEQEVDQYITEHAEHFSSGKTMHLSRIAISTINRTNQEAAERAEQILAKLAAGIKFSDLAKEFSDATEASEGGALGTFAENELSSEVAAATTALTAGANSAAIKIGSDLVIFRVDQRLDSSNGITQEQRDEIRGNLKKQKSEAKMYGYFTSELPKQYTIERKV